MRSRDSLLVSLWALIVPAVGLPLFFRNEAGRQLVQVHALGLFDLLHARVGEYNFRPVVYAVWWLIDRGWGLSPGAYLAANAAFQIAAMLLLYRLVARFRGREAGLLAVGLHQAFGAFLQLCLLNAVYGLFYPMLLTFFLLSVLAFLDWIALGRGLWRCGLWLLLAVGTHAFACVLLPATLVALALFPPLPAQPPPGRRLAAVLALGALALALLPLVQSTRGQVPLDSVRAFAEFAAIRFRKAAEILRFGPAGLLVFAVGLPLTWAATRNPNGSARGFAQASRWAALSLGLLVFAFWLPVPALALGVAGLGVRFVRDPGARWVTVWCAVALGLFLITHDMVAAYLQPFALACAVLAGLGPLTAGAPSEAAARRLRLGAWALTATGFALLAALRTLPVPALARLYQPVHMMRQATFNLRDFLAWAQAQPPGARYLQVSGYARADAASIYSAEEVAHGGTHFIDPPFLEAWGIRATMETWTDANPPPLREAVTLVALDRYATERVRDQWGLTPDVTFGSPLQPAVLVRARP